MGGQGRLVRRNALRLVVPGRQVLTFARRGLYRDALTAANAWTRLTACFGARAATTSPGSPLRGRGPVHRPAATGTDQVRRCCRTLSWLEGEYGTGVAVAVAVRQRRRICPPQASPGSMELPQCARPGRPVRGLPALLASVFTDRAIVYRNETARSPEDRPFGRRHEDGALGPGIERRGVHARRHRIPDVVFVTAARDWARTSSRAASTPTNSTCTSPRSAPAADACCVVHWAATAQLVYADGHGQTAR